MKRLLLPALLLALAGCGDDDEPSTERPPETEPVASVPEPAEPMAMRCSTEGLDAPGLTNLAAEGVECSEAESVLLSWLEDQEVEGYVCMQERFAGSRSDVECLGGDASVRFSFG